MQCSGRGPRTVTGVWTLRTERPQHKGYCAAVHPGFSSRAQPVPIYVEVIGLLTDHGRKDRVKNISWLYFGAWFRCGCLQTTFHVVGFFFHFFSIWWKRPRNWAAIVGDFINNSEALQTANQYPCLGKVCCSVAAPMNNSLE